MILRPEFEAEIKDRLSKALAEIDERLTPEERASGAYGQAAILARAIEWVPSPEENLYVPNDRLKQKLQQYATPITGRSQADFRLKGELMEEIATLAFKCIKGCTYLKSYPSYAEQHDLVVGGDTTLWELSSKTIFGKETNLTVVIEAKYLSKPVDSAQFTRLCYILQNKFTDTSCLGVFFSDKGATGMERSRSLHETKATQALFHAKTGKYVIVLDRDDILKLDQPGALIHILRAKIRNVEAGAEISWSQHANLQWTEVQLPPHLAQHI